MSEKQPIGAYVISNNLVVAVLDIFHDIEDSIQWKCGEEKGVSIIEHNEDIGSFFKVGELEIPLSEVVRFDY